MHVNKVYNAVLAFKAAEFLSEKINKFLKAIFPATMFIAGHDSVKSVL